MAQPQLSVRSARARDLAHRLAASERRSVAQVVEQALEYYAMRTPAQNKSAAEFHARLNRIASVDVDFDELYAELRVPYAGPEV